ncbi:leucine Rich repeat-containing domain protein [Ancylostoma caninum]|uniref:Leucine Rich repeat-containing domain protein n=1 Tax=Ancylostoma caninum TaxID=29170 RepID=A0A368GL62_ANCCA|nr:leucine Rich repeat-containing domain protein [Ancylostoma caninum]
MGCIRCIKENNWGGIREEKNVEEVWGGKDPSFFSTAIVYDRSKMRLECEVVILRDSDHCLGISARRSTKTSKAIVTLGKNHIKGGFRYLLHVATKAAPRGPQIEIAPGNIKNVHRERVSAGRMSLVFVDPPVTLIVMKSIPAHLQRFLEKLLAILKGDDVSLKSLDKVKQSDFKAAIKSMKVTSDNLRGITYPPSLETLEVTSLALRSIDSRWFSLPLLTSLDLSCNRLGQADNFLKIKLISKLTNLRVLSLERNEINALPPFFFDLLPSSLLALNLSQNLLVSLPDSIVKAKSLQNLNLSHNLLTSLPRDISDMPLRCLFLTTIDCLACRTI